jgi:hypothetical protein
MTESSTAGRVGDNLPGQSAMVELLRVQSAAPARSVFQRIFGRTPLTEESRAWFDAAASEIEVGDALEQLSDDWVVLHSLPVGSGATDIDHIAIGPTGVYIINTNSHAGQSVWVSQRSFLVAGVRHPHIRNMEYEMGRAERLLGAAAGEPVEVSGIIAVFAARSITVHEQHRDVAVLAASDLVSWLSGRAPTLSPERVAAIGESAGRADTWHRSLPVGDRAILRSGFDRVDRLVRRAGRRRTGWLVSAIGVSALALGVAVETFMTILFGTPGW